MEGRGSGLEATPSRRSPEDRGAAPVAGPARSPAAGGGGLLDTAVLRGREWHLHWEGSGPIGAWHGARPAGEKVRDDLKITHDDQGRPASITNDTGGFERFDYRCAAGGG